ncbi:hypothetical protein FB567DRAFT_14829 [Paraphoma chrysanthemicola]|uniref:Survival motor neuron Tudor domain-containing protein n=1 Tax=Paraphoma chrysanthemicola TaxID=798071 RepID=A0A8K0W4F3_9PLEO|nr:hypothetical protein FB567DRAFT_14829 [Paraphoma chrysanthemicola]
MAPGIDMSDKNAWDDSLLMNSWNDAVKEYERFHSIHKSGKRLEDVLSEEELRELREDYGDDLEVETPSGVAAETNGDVDQGDTEMTHVETNGVEHADQSKAQQQEAKLSEHQHSTAGTPVQQDGNPASTVPQALLGTVQDENLKNIMMSWYYAGYYTGLYTGQQQQPKEAPSKE